MHSGILGLSDKPNRHYASLMCGLISGDGNGISCGIHDANDRFPLWP